MILPSNDFINKFKETPGAFSVSEYIALYNVVLEAPKGVSLELGSNKGKSSQAVVLALKEGDFYLVEPEFQNSEWQMSVIDKVQDINKKIKILPLADYSLNIINNFNQLSFVLVDSGLHDDMVMEEAKLLEDRIISGGIIAFHDYLNQFTAVERAYNYLISTEKYEPISINWSEIFDYVRENNLEEGNNSWHEKGSNEFPCYVGALKRKQS